LLLPSERLSVAEWAVARRKLSKKTTHLAGDWSHDYTPFGVEIMEALSDVGTRQVTVQKCSQAAGTEIGLNFIGWIVDESPAPVLVVMPKETDAVRRVRTRIKPMFKACPTLLRHVGFNVDNINVGTETDMDHMILYLAWSGSASALADNPVCYVILDEVGKFPVKTGKESDPVSLAKDRQRTFFSRSKLYCPSTPVMEGDLVDREHGQGDQRKCWVACVHCGQRHVMIWKYYQLDKDSAGGLLSAADYASGRCARYVCPECGAAWTEQERWLAVSAGRWAPRDCRVTADGRIEGRVFSNPHKSYQITAFMLYPGFMTAGRLAEKWADAQVAKHDGDIGPLQDFINSECAEPFREETKETDETRLAIHINTHKPEIVPAGAQILTAGADVQIDHIWVWLWGWGYLSQVWSVVEARLETGDTRELENYGLLREFLNMTWPTADGAPPGGGGTMTIRKTAIDCAYRGDVVYDFIAQCRELDIVPVRGDDSVRLRTWREVPVRGGTIKRYDLNTGAYKDSLHRLLYESTVPGPGFMHLHRDTTEDTLRQLSSERQVTARKRRKVRTVWMQKKGRPNHLWDCGVYAFFAGDIAGARTIRDPAAPTKKKVKLSQVQMQKRAGQR